MNSKAEPTVYFPVTFDSDAYWGGYGISLNELGSDLWIGTFSGQFGKGDCYLPDGHHHLVLSPGANFSFELRNGKFYDCKSCGLQCDGSILRFQACEIVIFPGDYPAKCRVVNVPGKPASGGQKFIVLKGLLPDSNPYYDAGYSLELAPGLVVRFFVDCSGNIILNPHNAGAAEVSGNSLTLKTVKLQIDAQDETIPWAIQGPNDKFANGSRPLILVPHTKVYKITVPWNGEKFEKGFCLDRLGEPSAREVVVDAKDRKFAFRLAKVA
jgi:hypothetical protein